MSKNQSKKVRRRKSVRTSPVSLPPSGFETDTNISSVPPYDASSVPAQADDVAPKQANLASTEVIVAPKKPFWQVGKDSKQYEQAMKILAMRTAGLDDKAIADAMGLSMQTVWNYSYIAGKNGWSTDFANAKDQIEFGIMPKVVRELEAGLDDRTRHVTSGMTVSQQMALKIAEGTVFKKFEQVGGDGTVVNNIIGIKIQTVPGAVTEMRVESGGDTPAYCDGEVDDVGTE